MIFHFSGTGNSLYVAKRLQKAIDGDLVNIADAVKGNRFEYHPGKDESIGFVFPVYFFGVPTIVRDLLGNLSLHQDAGNHTFLVLTCGESSGNAGAMFRGLLEGRDYRLDSVSSVVLPNNYVLFYEMEGHDEQRRMFAAADMEIDAIIARVREGRTGPFDKNSGRYPSIATALSYPIYRYGRRAARFRSTDACIGCGQCERICPSGTVRIVSGRPEWVQKRCVHCLACINRCPQRAIQYGKGTEGRGRYSNPNVSFESE